MLNAQLLLKYARGSQEEEEEEVEEVRPDMDLNEQIQLYELQKQMEREGITEE